ncbi:hypothetical protein [Paraferrimonas sp. SM1919]|uniref:hypothetical protein n=1 Tax=Paraferrimonas sp. SM1919 TaxID=2662263 RepID=UPI0013D2A656|nr:hypothetical protein [Paraferrimonas sp. SM1919]
MKYGQLILGLALGSGIVFALGHFNQAQIDQPAATIMAAPAATPPIAAMVSNNDVEVNNAPLITEQSPPVVAKNTAEAVQSPRQAGQPKTRLDRFNQPMQLTAPSGTASNAPLMYSFKGEIFTQDELVAMGVLPAQAATTN